MFTGIVEEVGAVHEVRRNGGNIHFVISARIASELRVDQSVAHNGVCLTVVSLLDSARSDNPHMTETDLSLRATPEEWAAGRAATEESRSDLLNGTYRVTAIEETLQRTNLGTLKPGDGVNLERCLRIGDRLDGHMVQGHVDTTTDCTEVEERDGSWWYTFRLPQQQHLLVHKGSICINGVSLTIAELTNDQFSVAIIPYTFEHTTFNALKPGMPVNIEFDVLGKYVERMMGR